MAKTYNARKVIVTFCGTRITGYADGDFCTAARNGDSFTLTKGADGEGARSANPDKSGKVTITLLQTSSSNDFLQAQLDLDERTDEGKGPLFIRDLSGRTLVESPEAWVVKPTDPNFSKEIGGREWVIECDELRITNGGN
jgi:hypothetical protein